MFTLNHFIWLGILTALIVTLTVLTDKFRIPHKWVCYFMCFASACSEITKILTSMKNATGDEGGMVLKPSSLPFHLCTVQIFLILIVTFSKNESFVHKVRCFMFPTALIGAIMACLIPTAGVTFDNVRIYEYFLFHACLIFFVIHMMRRGLVRMGWGDAIRNYILMVGILVFGLWINSILSVYDTNFLYVVRPPMEGLPLLNLDNGWHAYIAALIVIALVLVSAFQIPWVLACRRRERKKMEDI